MSDIAQNRLERTFNLRLGAVAIARFSTIVIIAFRNRSSAPPKRDQLIDQGLILWPPV